MERIDGQWRDGRADGRWEWLKANGERYLAAEFDRGRVVKLSPDLLSPRVLEQLVGDWSSPLECVTPFEEWPSKMTLAELEGEALRRFNVGDERESLGALPENEPLPVEMRNESPFVILAKALAQRGLGYDLRHGEIVIDTRQSISDWRDLTGVTDLQPMAGSRLTDELDRPTDLDVVEMPARDVFTYLGEKHSIEIRLEAEIDEESVEELADAEVTISVKNVLLCHAIGRILDKLNCKVRLEGETLVVERR